MTTASSPMSALVEAAESIFSALTGKKNDNQQKIIDGAAHLLDGLLPTVESKVSFDLATVLTGATGLLSGVALVITGVKTKRSENPAPQETPQTPPHTGVQ